MNEVQIGRFSGILHKLLDMKESSPAPTLAPEIIPTLQLEGNRPEWGFLAGERLAAGFDQSVGGAGEISHVILDNPATSNALITVERIVAVTFDGAGDNYLIGIQVGTAPTFSASGAGVLRDSRWGAAQSIGLIATRENAAPMTNDVVSFEAPIQTTLVFDFPFVLAPASRVYVRNGAVARTTTAAFFWRERVLEASETR